VELTSLWSLTSDAYCCRLANILALYLGSMGCCSSSISKFRNHAESGSPSIIHRLSSSIALYIWRLARQGCSIDLTPASLRTLL
jgi:hypothetical protein